MFTSDIAKGNIALEGRRREGACYTAGFFVALEQLVPSRGQLRQAIDRYKLYNDQSNGTAIPIEWKTPTGYPKELKLLVDGFTPANVVGTSEARVRFLRRLPIDPLTGTTEWGMRSYKDKPDSTSWGGEDVFDVYTKSGGEALNGTKYKDW